MKSIRISLISISFLLLSLLTYSQDKRTTETKVADLLARFPANDLQLNDKLMGDMLIIGDAGLKQVCDMIIPADTGIKFVFLMHPKEAYHQKTGTGRLTNISLCDSEIIIGIDFSENARLN